MGIQIDYLISSLDPVKENGILSLKPIRGFIWCLASGAIPPDEYSGHSIPSYLTFHPSLGKSLQCNICTKLSLQNAGAKCLWLDPSRLYRSKRELVVTYIDRINQKDPANTKCRSLAAHLNSFYDSSIMVHGAGTCPVVYRLSLVAAQISFTEVVVPTG